MTFLRGDVVRKEKIEHDYIIVDLRTAEPCCQIQLGDDLASRHWAISHELELVSRSKPAAKRAKQH